MTVCDLVSGTGRQVLTRRTIDDPAFNLRRFDLEEICDDSIRQIATDVLECKRSEAKQADFTLELRFVKIYTRLGLAAAGRT